ncbi:Serine/threonine-protein kinase PknA [Nymphon striatum]|nr:Serine/threonine-protein kinase PknA [Nymphon striatum]
MMISSLLWVESTNINNDIHVIDINAKSRIEKNNSTDNIAKSLRMMLEQYFPEMTLHTASTEKIKKLDLRESDYELILTHEKPVVRDANLAGIDAILWEKLSDLSAKLDVFLQLRRYLEKYPLKLNGWSLKEVIHNNRDAVIYRAVDESGHTVAIKRFKYELDHLPVSSIQDFLANIQTQCSLQSSGLVRIYEGGVCDRAFYLVMEYMNHGTLCESLRSCGVLPLAHAMQWFKEIAKSLDCVHQAGLIHRDLKTANIMLNEDGSLALSDYGVSKGILLETGFITEDEIHCSPYFVSPEQVSGEPCTQASDIYSLGVVFYELLTGTKPYENSRAFELMMCHVMAPAPVLPDELANFQGILNRMMAKDYHERFSSELEMKNVGGIDRILRIVIGAAVLAYAAYLWKTTGSQPSPWYLLGAVPLLTGLIGWCPTLFSNGY